MSYTKLNELLSNRKTVDERFKELSELVPNFLNGKKIYYHQTSYVRYDVENKVVYSGLDKYANHETIVNTQFPYVFYIAGVNGALEFAKIYQESEELQKDKSFHLDENGFVVLKDYGVVSNDSVIKSILEPTPVKETIILETNEEQTIVNSILNEIEEDIKKEEIKENKKSSKKKSNTKKTNAKKESKKTKKRKDK